MKLIHLIKRGLTQAAACLSVISMLVGVHPMAYAQSAETPSQVISRTAQSPLQLSTSLSNNLYRQEAYQANYTVQVPYETTEAYTDYETYYENEYQCRTEYEQSCGYEQECRRVGGGRDCRQERVCGRGIFSGGSHIMGCQTVEECGTNARGERICKTRQKCDGGGGGGGGIVRPDPGPVRPGPGHGGGGGGGGQSCRYETRCYDAPIRNECRNEYRCRQIPRERCSNVSVPRTRPVTKYRTVTKYRSETKCCKTEYRQVFDRQESLDVVINFPAGSELFQGERESFKVSLLAGVNQQADVQFEVLSQISNYRVIDKTIQGRLATLTLEAIPVVIDPAQVGASSVSDLRLKIMEDLTGVVVFNDNGQKGRLVTLYDIIVRDGAGNVVAAQQASYSGTAAHRIVLDQKLSFRDHTLELRVSRSGQGLDQPVTFVKTFFRPG